MTREQAQAIIKNLDLIRHYADGGDVGHRLIDYRGNQLRVVPTKSINLANLHPERDCLYVRVKPRLVLSGGALTRRQRCFTESILPIEIIE